MHFHGLLALLVAIRSHPQAFRIYLLLWAFAVIIAGLVGGWGN